MQMIEATVIPHSKGCLHQEQGWRHGAPEISYSCCGVTTTTVPGQQVFMGAYVHFQSPE